MKIYILRHEARYESPTFYTQLTAEGLKKSEDLKYILEKENINLIFSSPFPRVLQTIQPFCNMKNMHKQVNVDYSLYETMYDECFTKNNYKIEITNNDKEYYLVNPNYKSIIGINDIQCPEDYSNVKFRTSNFLNYITSNFSNTDYNVLIASHGAVINSILNIRDVDKLYPIGGLTKIYENNLTCYNPINFYN